MTPLTLWALRSFARPFARPFARRFALPLALPCALSVAVLSAAAPCVAQPRPDPLDTAAPVPALTYRSSLHSFRALGDDKPLPWKEANDATARIGGWRAYAREARAPAPAAAASAARPGPETKN